MVGLIVSFSLRSSALLRHTTLRNVLLVFEIGQCSRLPWATSGVQSSIGPLSWKTGVALLRALGTEDGEGRNVRPLEH